MSSDQNTIAKEKKPYVKPEFKIIPLEDLWYAYKIVFGQENQEDCAKT